MDLVLLLAQTLLPCHIMAETAHNIVNAPELDNDTKVEFIQQMTKHGCLTKCHNDHRANN